MSMQKGLLISVFTMFMAALWDVFSRFSVSTLHANPTLFSALSLFAAAFTLTIIAGPGKGGLKTVRSLHTWLYTIFQMATGIFEAYAYTVVTTTEANLLFRISIILSVLMAFAIFGRKPSRHDFVGSFVVLVGLGYLCTTLNDDIRMLAILYVAASSLFFVLRTFVAETHPESNEASTVKDQCRVTGVVLAITSMIFVIFYGFVGLIVDETGGGAVLGGLPSFEEFKNPVTIGAALFCGAAIISVVKYLYFYVSKTVKTENYMIVGTLIPVFAYLLELLGSQFGLLDISSIDYHDFIAGFLIVAGAFYMAVMRGRRGEHS